MKITIEKIIYPGKSLARQERLVIMTDEGLPGETVEAEITKKKKNYAEATTLEIISPAVGRTSPKCGHYRVCSPYQYIDYIRQLEIKKIQLEEMLSHALKSPVKEINVTPSPVLWGYRNKISLKVIKEKDEILLAYNLPGHFDEFIKIDRCFLASENINSAMSRFISLANTGLKELELVEALTIRESVSEGKLMLVLYGTGKTPREKFTAMAKALSEKLGAASLYYSDQKTGRVFLLYGEEALTEKVAGKTFFMGPGSFFQVNVPILEKVIEKFNGIFDQAKPESFLDLYCGTGLFGIVFSDRMKKVTGVESEAENAAFLEKALKSNGIKNYFLVKEDCEKAAEGLLKEKPDFIMIDPPRAGADKALISLLSGNPAPYIAYLSCDPATMARDLKALSVSYELLSVDLFDFFPHTPHIEALAFLHSNHP